MNRERRREMRLARNLTGLARGMALGLRDSVRVKTIDLVVLQVRAERAEKVIESVRRYREAVNGPNGVHAAELAMFAELDAYDEAQR